MSESALRLYRSAAGKEFELHMRGVCAGRGKLNAKDWKNERENKGSGSSGTSSDGA